ncbi:RluA family pseudouridine synthase [uncultured Sneathiella sp.]|uniref:RluA family pseudouridine synthase n=1 Tax=uncultured Sneathiella sp. TaxID=879315 RepID=UPI0030EE3C4A|tara:strand:- start:15552 stop:16250 length:699 start_codon:yes stop_codon:yes gene_type:complete
MASLLQPPGPYSPPPVRPEDIVYEDEYLLALNKPSGLLSVPGRGGDLADCAEARAKAQDRNARTVHRLDMDTSGLLLFGKGAEMHRRLSKMFAARDVEKRYLAWVQGVMVAEAGEIDLPLAVDWPNRPKQKIDAEGGKPSLTRWQLLESSKDASLLALTPETGRTHQLRLHCAAIGHPILGDRIYATNEAFARAPRLQLHAERLVFHHPETGAEMRLTAPSPLTGPTAPDAS